ncbi:MAG: acyloxyacyl hydrolase [Tepidimonas ignava]|nr:acyloxyacyl hydrolase [Tepidimonas ignava]
MNHQTLVRNVIVTALLGVATTAALAQPQPARWSAALRMGSGGSTDHGALEWRRPMDVDMAWGAWRARSSLQLELGRWMPANGPTAQHVGAAWHVRLTPSGMGWRPYLEGAFGVALFDRTRIGGRNIASALQFTEQVGAGVSLGERLRLGWRYTHYSNAGLAMPNDGVDKHNLIVEWSY